MLAPIVLFFWTLVTCAKLLSCGDLVGLAPFCTAALKDTLIEKDLGIDGIRESVLYVAGVGSLLLRREAKQ